MNEQQILEKAMEMLADVSKNTKSRSVDRLEAMAPIMQAIPWQDTHTVEIDWKTMPAHDGELEFLPTLKVVMKGELP